MVEYRPIAPSQDDRFERIRQYAFHPADGPHERGTTERSGPGDQYGLFAGEQLRAICLEYSFDARLRGDWIELGGLGTVATAPEHRQQGHARQLLRGAVQSFASTSVPLVALWPFETAFYRQFGWATANKETRYECDPEALVGIGDGVGCFAAVEPDEWRSLREVNLAAGEGETMSRKRSETWWRRRIFTKWGDERRHVYRYDRDGSPAGYVVHSVSDGHLEVDSLGAVDHDAYREVLSFLGNHRAQIDRIAFERTAESELFDLVTDPSAVDCAVTPGPMIRVTDAASALETVPYPDGVTSSVTLSISDPLVAANDGIVRLDVTDGDGNVEQAPDETPEAHISIGTLSGLVVGSHDTETAVRAGGLSTEGPDVRQRLDRLFPPERVYLREYF